MMQFINSFTDTIISVIRFIISFFHGILNLINLSISFVSNLINSLNFLPEFLMPYIFLFIFVSLLFFFLNRRVE